MNILDWPLNSAAMMESTKNNRELECQVSGFLRDLDPSAGRRVTVEAVDGVLTLTGQVETFYIRQLFVHCCRQIPGVTAVDDNLDVRRKHSSVRPPDTQIG